MSTVSSASEFSAATVATTISLATLILAYAELASWAGTWLLWTVLTTAIGIALVRTVSKRLWSRLQTIDSFRPTLHGFLGTAYNSKGLALVASLCTSIGFLAALAVELSVGSRFLAALAPDIPQFVGILCLAAIGVLYTVLGGFRAVVLTDRMQMVAIWASIAALVGLIGYAIASNSQAGILIDVPSSLYDFSYRDGLWAFLIGVAIINIPTFLADMSVWQRIAASKSLDTVSAGVVKSVASVVVSWTLLAGIALSLTLVVQAPEGINPLLAFLQKLQPQLSTLLSLGFLIVVVGLYAASLSTASTQLIAAAHSIHIDLIRRGVPPSADERPAYELFLSRGILVVASVLSVGLVEALRAAGFNIADLVFAIYGAQLGMVPAVVVALFVERKHLKSLGQWVAIAVAGGFVAGWASACAGKLMDNADLVFLSPAVSLLFSGFLIGAGYLIVKRD